MRCRDLTVTEELENFSRARRPVKSAERIPGSVPYLGASGVVDFVDGFTHEGDFLCISEDGENLRSRNTPIAWVQRGRFWANNHLHVLGGLPLSRLRFYEAALSHANVASYLTGSAQPKLSQESLNTILLPRFSGVEQAAIGEVLGALDDKIAANRRVVTATLDLAEAMYLSACKNGSESIALKEAGKWLSGGTPRTSTPEFWDGELPWVSAASLKTFYLYDSERQLTASGASAATNIVPAGTVLFVVRGMSLKKEFRFGIAQRDVAFGQDCKAILPRISSSVLALGLRTSRSEILDLVDEAGHGTGRLPTDRLEQHLIDVPADSSVVEVLDALVSRGAVAERESARLATTRDVLIPLLMNGRITVRDAERRVEAQV